MISDEAVEAAAIALCERKHIEGVGLADVRHALEAAAPYIADSWHDAVFTTYAEGSLSADQANIMWDKNPYRSQA